MELETGSKYLQGAGMRDLSLLRSTGDRMHTTRLFFLTAWGRSLHAE